MSEQAIARARPAPVAATEAPAGILQRKCSCGRHTPDGGECANCRKKRLSVQRSAIGNAAPPVPPIVHSALRSPGQPLDAAARSFLEPRFGQDFSHVRVHTDAEAADSARAISARAYTVGSDVVFGAGEYSPRTERGRALLAHELAHVVQQRGARIQPSLTVARPGDAYEREAEAIADTVMRTPVPPTEVPADAPPARSVAAGSAGPVPGAISSRLPAHQAGGQVHMVPAPPSNSTYRYCGFGITTPIPGFVQSHFTGSFDVDYTTGCSFIWLNAWSSLWELYDSGNTLLDSDSESPFGDYTISGSDVASGTPGGGQAKWSLWYQITHSQPWLTSDPDAYPHDWVEFDVYADPIRNPNTTLREETGPIVWQDNFTPAEDGASLSYSFSATDSRQTTDSQTSTVSVTVGGESSSSAGFEYEGLTAGFARSLNFSSTASISRTHSVSVSSSQTLSKQFTQPNLRGGVTYSVKMRPLYHLIDGSVDTIPHRNGVISGTGSTVTGAIRVLKGMDIQITGNDSAGGGGGDGETTARRWSCDAQCNVEGTEPQCQNKRVSGHGTGSSEEDACRNAKRDATQKAPRGCYARHCRCLNCTNR